MAGKRRKGDAIMKRSFEKSNILNQFKKLNIGCHQKSWQSRNTYRKSTQRILKFCYEQYNIQKIENIQNKHIQAYIETQEDKSLSTLKKEISGFRSYINLLNNIDISRGRRECKFSASNFDLGINGTKEFNMRTAPTREEYNNIFKEIDLIQNPEIQKILKYGTYLGGEFGLRSKEIFCLKVSQVKDCFQQIGSNSEKVFLKLDGEGCKGGRKRQIGPLSLEQRQMIYELFSNCCRDKYVDDYVLRNRNIENSLSKRLSLWHNFYSKIGSRVSSERRREQRPEFDNHLSAHSLRRFFAVNLYNRVRETQSHEKALNIVFSNLGHGVNRNELARHYLNSL